MSIPEDAFGALMREMAETEGAELLAGEAEWRALVPAHIDRAAALALQTAPAPAAGARRAARAAPLRGAVKAAAGALAAVAVAAGALAASPALRESVAALLSGSPPAVTAAQPAARRPGDYRIPDPGPGFTVADHTESESLVYAWYTAPDREVLVEIAYRLPADSADPADAEYVTVAGLTGVYYEDGDKKTVHLWDGRVQLLVVFFNGAREDLLRYAGEIVNS